MSAVFNSPTPTGREIRENLDQWIARFPKALASPDVVRNWLGRQTTPAHFGWIYCGNGKTGTSSTRRFLFELEFGVPLTTRLQASADINPDAIAHFLSKGDVFRQLIDLPDSIRIFNNAFRFTTVRHPVTRALSSFFYICQSQDEEKTWFVKDRVRMNAIVKFDWEKDSRTPDGFSKFLDYISYTIDSQGLTAVNGHWRPQIGNVRPGVFKPHLVGKTEDLESFFAAIAERLDKPLPGSARNLHANKGAARPDNSGFLNPANLARIEQIYQRDFEQFGYQLDDLGSLG